MGKFLAYLSLARVSNSPTIVSNVVAGAALAGVHSFDSRHLLVSLALLSFYWAGMYLNDYCDFELDCVERPDRPLPRGAVGKEAALLCTIGLFIIGLFLLGVLSYVSLCGGIVLLILIVLYDVWHKENPFSPLLMGLCRFMVYAISFAVFEGVVLVDLLLYGGLFLLYVVGVTSLAGDEVKEKSKRWWPIVFIVVPGLTFMFSGPNYVSLLVVLVFTAWCLYSVWVSYFSLRAKVVSGVGQLLAGISLFDAAVVAVFGGGMEIVGCLAAFLLTGVLHRYIKGT